MMMDNSGREHEHEFEPQYGLPERLPQGESILWQASQTWRPLPARHSTFGRFACILPSCSQPALAWRWVQARMRWGSCFR